MFHVPSMAPAPLTPAQPGPVATPLGLVRPLRLLGKGKSGYSHLAELAGRDVVLKVMHDEPCSYYRFEGSKVRAEVAAWETLSRLGMPVPALLSYNVERQFLVKDYVEGTVAADWAPSPHALDHAVTQLLGMSRKLQAEGLNIDYFPANFVVTPHGIHYIDYETAPYADAWNLPNWGLYYWANLGGMHAFRATGDWRHINVDETSGQPIREPFAATVQRWLQDLQHGDHAAPSQGSEQ